jgi:hypothetical protein
MRLPERYGFKAAEKLISSGFCRRQSKINTEAGTPVDAFIPWHALKVMEGGDQTARPEDRSHALFHLTPVWEQAEKRVGRLKQFGPRCP